MHGIDTDPPVTDPPVLVHALDEVGDMAATHGGRRARVGLRQLARAREGAKEVRIGFRLTDLPELGVFSFVSASWELAAELPALAAAPDVSAVPALGVLRCELVEFITRFGLTVSYRRPVVEVGGTQVLAQDAVRLAA